jgi:fluoride exporter
VTSEPPEPENVDPDLGPAAPAVQGAGVFGGGSTLRTALAVAVGGAIGGLARYGLNRAWPTAPGCFAWATFAENVLGCLLIGLLMVFVLDLWPTRPYLRPFLVTGVLGGFTTFSAYALDTRSLLAAGHVPLGLAYLFGTVVAGLVAVVVGLAVGRKFVPLFMARRSAP